jgi:4-diphosphocytidyl-2-C-methyl-D-erythritol kinase
LPVPTKAVFAAWKPAPAHSAAADIEGVAELTTRQQLLEFLAAQSNDLEEPATSIAPPIADVLAALRKLPGCKLARMSGSGATCFALFGAPATARKAVTILGESNPAWWVKAIKLG